MNLLTLDEERVMVERQEEELARKLRDWGFQTIPCTFTQLLRLRRLLPLRHPRRAAPGRAPVVLLRKLSGSP